MRVRGEQGCRIAPGVGQKRSHPWIPAKKTPLPGRWASVLFDHHRPPPPMKRPSILFLFTDQQRWDTLGAAGFPHMRTPHLDRLAAEGVRFTHAFCNNPVCMPSRQSLFTGQYPSAVDCTTNGIELPEDRFTVAHLLQRAGYRTANLGKLHFKNHSSRDHREPHPQYGFDHIEISDEPGCYEDAYLAWVRSVAPEAVEDCRCSSPPVCVGPRVVKAPRETDEPHVFAGPEGLTHSAFVAERTMEAIRRRGAEPFFIVAGFYAPHCPLNPPARFLEAYDPAELPPPQVEDDPRGLPWEKSIRRHGEAKWREIRRHYYALVSHVDDQIGRILDCVEEEGLAEETLVVFASDHGEHLGDHGLIQKGPPGLDSCIRVPLILRHPGRLPAGAVREDLAELVDLAPTFAEAAGVQAPPSFQGKSLYRDTEREAVFVEHREPGGAAWKTIRSRSAKYCRNNYGRELLYDLQEDPAELRDRSADPAAAGLKQELRERLLAKWFEVERPPNVRTGAY
ncbi:MAG: hypothetical protein EA425_17325 [Puniceicoccaceae bacterium]|nr:MAG: hypothetical protein EA425_17325 [Puniceicoccaceae bacterium]